MDINTTAGLIAHHTEGRAAAQATLIQDRAVLVRAQARFNVVLPRDRVLTAKGQA